MKTTIEEKKGPVTTDRKVLELMVTFKNPHSSRFIAQKMQLTVFQITARLKAMEGRKLIKRDESGKWSVTLQGQQRLAAMQDGTWKEPTPVAARVQRVEQFASDLMTTVRAEIAEGVPLYRALKGWKVRYIWSSHDSRFDIYRAPDGLEFRRVDLTERADLIVQYATPGMPPIRLKILEPTLQAQLDVWRERVQVIREALSRGVA